MGDRSALVLMGALAGAVGLFGACGSPQDTGGGGQTGGTSSSAGSSGTTKGGAGSGAGGIGGFLSSSGAGAAPPACETEVAVDDDQDGFTEEQGDCNDCDANVNPGAIEVTAEDPMAEPADEDCDGTPDNVAAACDTGLALDDTDPKNGARAIDLCQFIAPADPGWGVLDAKYVRANGQPAANGRQFGILSGFGPNVHVQLGERMLALSSGAARTPGQPDACNTYKCSDTGAGTPPPGFPQDAPGCPQAQNINDDIGLELKIRAPTNATGFHYAFKFYSFEFAEYVCTNYNDQFIALMSPAPDGSMNGNISFDSNGSPVSVNLAFFDVCDPIGNNDFAINCNNNCPPKPNPYCPAGPSELEGTGFTPAWGQDAGATLWLATTAPVTGGQELTIRFAIWDTGGFIYDSTVLIDGFTWIANGGTVVIGTDPLEEPK